MPDTIDLWGAGFQNLSTGTQAPDTRPGTPADTRPDTPADTWPGTPAGTPDADDEPGTPLPVGQWEPVPGGEPPAREVRSIWTLLASHTAGSPMLGAGSLAAELANPDPDTWTSHWQHATRHPNRPAGQIAGVLFIAGHLTVTGPVKLTGKTMTAAGRALSWAGLRTDQAGDNFTAAAILTALAGIVITILVITVVMVISHLP